MRAVEVGGTEVYFVEPEPEVEEMAAVEVRVVLVFVPGVSLEGSEVGGKEDGIESDVAPFEPWEVGPPAGANVDVVDGVAPVPVFETDGDCGHSGTCRETST